MSEASDKLREMIGSAQTESENLQSGISQIEDIKEDVTEQISAIEDGLCTVAADDLTTYLTDVKLPEFQAIQPTAVLDFGGDYGSIDYDDGNITDWEIYYMTVVIPPATPVKVVLYEYEGTGWDSDEDIIKWVEDYDFGNDYLTRPLDSGATYGLIPYKENLDSALDILNNNKDKVDDSVAILGDYAT